MHFKITPSQFSFFSFILILISFSSCSIKKRSYRKGYHIDWVFNKTKQPEVFRKCPTDHPLNQQSAEIVKEITPRNIICAPQNTFANSVFASGKAGSTGIFRIKPITPDSCADMIYLKDGTEFSATIIELTEEKVRYRRCDKNQNEIQETKKGKILMIRFSNGKVESYNEETFELKNPPVHPLAIFSFTTAILSILLLIIGLVYPVILLVALASAIVSLVSGAKARKKIMSNVGEYKGLRLIRAARVLGWITLIIITVMILLSLIGLMITFF